MKRERIFEYNKEELISFGIYHIKKITTGPRDVKTLFGPLPSTVIVEYNDGSIKKLPVTTEDGTPLGLASLGFLDPKNDASDEDIYIFETFLYQDSHTKIDIRKRIKKEYYKNGEDDMAKIIYFNKNLEVIKMKMFINLDELK